MIRIRYSEGEGCDISGTPSELRAIKNLICHAITNNDSFTVEAETMANPWPYQRLLHSLALKVIPGPVCARVIGDVLEVRGSAEFLEKFSSWFAFRDDTPVGHHGHYEYYEGNIYVSPDSIPLVISVGAKKS